MSMARTTTSAARGARVEQLPREIYLEASNWCNLKCRTCPQFFGMPEPTAHLTAKRAKAVLDQLPRVDRAVLHGIGEPLLNPELPALVTLVKARGAHALFNTNGTVLSRRLIEPVIS